MQQPAEGGQGSCKLGLHLMLSRSLSSPNLPCEPGLCRITLLITPSRLEKQFWSSVRAVKLLDAVGLFNSVMLNVMLIRKFGWGGGKPDMLWHFLPVLLYLTAGLVQLALLTFKPDLHQRNRFAINLANRLIKAVTVTWAAINMSQTDVMNQFAGTLNSVPHAAAGQHDMSTYMKILRTVASLPLLWVSHAVNFMLPFWLLLPLQLYTLIAVSKVVPSIVCVLLGQPLHILQPATVIATHVHGAVRTLIALALPIPMQWPWLPDLSSGDPAAQDLLVLVAVTFVLILMIIPCVVAYHVELLWKTDFLRTQRSLQPELERVNSIDDGGPQSSWLSSLWITHDIVCLSLLFCEAVVRLASPALLESCSVCPAPASH